MRMPSFVFIRFASSSKTGSALGGKSVLATAKGILNKLPSGLMATVPAKVEDVGAGARATRVAGLGAPTVGAISGAVGGGTDRGAAAALGFAITGFGSAGGGLTGVSVLGTDAGIVSGRGFDRLTTFTFGAAANREGLIEGSVSFDFGTTLGFTACDFTRGTGSLDWVGRFSCVIDAGGGGLTARVGDNVSGIICRLGMPRVLANLSALEGFIEFGRFSVERGIWRGGLAK